MPKFKVGDKVRSLFEQNVGEIGEIIEILDVGFVVKGFSRGAPYGEFHQYSECFLELITNQNTMNIKEKFVLALTPEPQKSFRKAGITNGDDLLTDDGQKIFLSWLLKQNQDQFKKEIVDDLLKEDKE